MGPGIVHLMLIIRAPHVLCSGVLSVHNKFSDAHEMRSFLVLCALKQA
jgi:hypothetical protein